MRVFLLVLLLSSCGGQPFEEDLFGTNQDAGAPETALQETSVVEAGPEASADAAAEADVPDAAPDVKPDVKVPDPCDQCVCNASGDLCPDQTNHCLPDVDGYRACCSCPASCVKPAPKCNWYPSTKLWCCA